MHCWYSGPACVFGSPGPLFGFMMVQKGTAGCAVMLRPDLSVTRPEGQKVPLTCSAEVPSQSSQGRRRG